jgi:hypothetical protein
MTCYVYLVLNFTSSSTNNNRYKYTAIILVDKIKAAMKINRNSTCTTPLVKGFWPQSYMGC